MDFVSWAVHGDDEMVRAASEGRGLCQAVRGTTRLPLVRGFRAASTASPVPCERLSSDQRCGL